MVAILMIISLRFLIWASESHLNSSFFRTKCSGSFPSLPSFHCFPLLTFPKPLSSVQLLDCKLVMWDSDKFLLASQDILKHSVIINGYLPLPWVQPCSFPLRTRRPLMGEFKVCQFFTTRKKKESSWLKHTFTHSVYIQCFKVIK